MRKLVSLCVLALTGALIGLPANAGTTTEQPRGSRYVHESWSDSAKRPAPRRGPKNKPEGRMPSRTGTGFEAITDPEQNPPPAAPEPAAPGVPRGPSPGFIDPFQGDLNSTSNEVVPPDTMGAVGTTHIMSVTNAAVRIRVRATGADLTPQTLDQFWAALGSPIVFDPRVFYDHLGSRWIFVAVANFEDPTSAVLVAVSDTSNPAGTWRKYSTDADAQNFAWADYPSVGFNKSWIVVQVNMFSMANSYVESNVYAFRKAQLNAGTLSFKRFVDQEGFAQAPIVSFDAALNEMYLIEDWWGEANGGTLGQLRMSKITGSVGNETYTSGYVKPSAAAPWDDNWNLSVQAPQQGTTTRIDVGDARMQNCVYRYGSIWCAHTIYLPSNAPNRSVVQWWKISPAGSVLQRGRIDTGVDTAMHAYPSIALNGNGDALLGFSSFSTTTYPSASYAFRTSTDPANTFRDNVLLKAGVDTYVKKIPPGSGDVRYGDYSATVVDPLNDADMWTVQEYAEQHSGATSIWATWWGRIASAGFAFPATLTSPLTVRFATDVGPVDADNVLVTLNGTSTVVNGSFTCKDAAGAALPNCASGVRTALFSPAPSWTAGQHYRIDVNPATASGPVQAGGVDLAPTVRGFRASKSEQETSASATYEWRTIGAAGAYGGSYRDEHLGASKARYGFTGTSVTWHTMTGPEQGIAVVYIDGVSRGAVDNYSASRVFKVARTYGGLTNSSHTIEVMVSGTKRAASKGTFIAVDAFNADQTPALTMTWHPVVASPASGGAYVATNIGGPSVTFVFRGTKITWYSLRGPNQGKANVYLDGAFKGTIDNYSPSVGYNLARSWAVADGLHSLKIVVLGRRNASSTNNYVAIDRFVIA